jgi:hypothetical protein
LRPAAHPHSLLPGVEGTIATILLKVGLSAVGEKDTPRSLEGATRLVETLGDAAGSQMAARIEAARVLSGLATRSAIMPTRTLP